MWFCELAWRQIENVFSFLELDAICLNSDPEMEKMKNITVFRRISVVSRKCQQQKPLLDNLLGV